MAYLRGYQIDMQKNRIATREGETLAYFPASIDTHNQAVEWYINQFVEPLQKDMLKRGDYQTSQDSNGIFMLESNVYSDSVSVGLCVRSPIYGEALALMNIAVNALIDSQGYK